MTRLPRIRTIAARSLHGGCLGTFRQGVAAVIGAALLLASGGVYAAAASSSGMALYEEHCAQCHNGGVPRAPHVVSFQLIGPEAILTALTTGVMRSQGSVLTPQERRQLAEDLGGASLMAAEEVTMPRCSTEFPDAALDEGPRPRDWGHSLANDRSIDGVTAGMAAKDVPRLRLKWAFAFPGATRARSQPTYAAGAVFVGSQDGTVYALDLETACVHWRFRAEAEVRNAPSIEDWDDDDPAPEPRLVFGDLKGNVYALDAFTGRELWRTRANAHPQTAITGSPRLFEDKVFVPLSSNEWASAADPHYECCSFQGGIVALDLEDGSTRWRTHTIDEAPALTGEKNSVGTRRRGPAGAPIWNSPTIDPKRRRLYVGTGEAYTSPAAPTSDAVLAFDLDSGERLWHYQSLAGDAWNMACYIGGGPNCPEENGPDLDIGAPPVLARLADGTEYLLVGQKSAHVFALNPDDGELLWRKKLGRGGFAGGVHWGMAFDGESLFVPIADTAMTGTEEGEAMPGLYAIDPATGETRWFQRNTDVCPEAAKPACDPGLSAPPTVIPGVVFAGAFDGWLRAYDSVSGEILWRYNTVRTYEAVNDLPARGGSLESTGPLVVDGHLLVNSGYLFGDRMPGNVLLAFSVVEE